ncbi:hypothetical protein PAAG_11369 [Paracoccidioides lutzii Pb01]|uniref:Uncharacterized protein n=1 Tax=Paracoccidioides lutzii (strain ATCC MYA-826 / Pb01) TaxID=502779 RepID=A0A0A2V2T8_PARBA|nr:hypothetical protein PAAG_11369 [Paracoccidioides lutzii Pb01]KGQ01798.1 hypothetical protein PAAG_11369 [Paracoccidioides lutzii Pb01]
MATGAYSQGQSLTLAIDIAKYKHNKSGPRVPPAVHGQSIPTGRFRLVWRDMHILPDAFYVSDRQGAPCPSSPSFCQLRGFSQQSTETFGTLPYLTIPPPPLFLGSKSSRAYGRCARHIEYAAAKPSQPSVFDAINYDTAYTDTVSATTKQYLHATICDRLQLTH